MSNQNTGKEKFSKFIRYSDGARMYHMRQSKFMQLAKEARACYKISQE